MVAAVPEQIQLEFILLLTNLTAGRGSKPKILMSGPLSLVQTLQILCSDW